MADFVKPFSLIAPTASDEAQSCDLEAVRSGVCTRIVYVCLAQSAGSWALIPALRSHLQLVSERLAVVRGWLWRAA